MNNNLPKGFQEDEAENYGEHERECERCGQMADLHEGICYECEREDV